MQISVQKQSKYDFFVYIISSIAEPQLRSLIGKWSPHILEFLKNEVLFARI